MDKILYESVFRVGSIMPIFKDRHENCCKETDNKQVKGKEVDFGEILEREIKKIKNT